MDESTLQVLAIIGSNLIIMLTFFGVSISLHNAIREEIRGIQNEMKDFQPVGDRILVTLKAWPSQSVSVVETLSL